MRCEKLLVNSVLLLLLFNSLPVFAFNLTAIESYLLMSKKHDLKNNKREFLWTGVVTNKVDNLNKNWNRPAIENWGVSDRYPGTPGMPIPLVKPYSETDPSFTGPNG